MGSKHKFVQVAAVAKELKCSEKTIRGWANKGLIRWQEKNGELFVDSEDINFIANLGTTEEMSNKEIIHELRMLQAQVDRLKASIDLSYDINRMSAGGMSKESTGYLMQLHRAISTEIELESWPIRRLYSYCEIFIRLSEEDVDRLNKALEEGHSWEPFYKLLIKIAHYIGTHPELDTNLELQHIRELLALGRTNLRAIALFFTRISGNSKASLDMLAELASNDIDSFDDLAMQLKATGCRGHLNLI